MTEAGTNVPDPLAGHARQTRKDAFETLLQKARPPLSDAETGRLLAEVHSDESAVAMRAEDLLVRHHLPWIVHYVTGHPTVTRDMLAKSSACRDDLLSEGCYGFLTAIRRYDVTQARRQEPEKGYKATLLKYARFWINQSLRAFIGPERYRLKARTWHKRHLVLTASATLHQRLGRRPDSTEIAAFLEARAREKQQAAGIPNPTHQQLRNMGALSPAVVTSLLTHAADLVSLDEPVGGTGSSAAQPASSPTWASYLPDETSAMQTETRLMQEDQARVIADILSVVDARLANPVLRRLQVRMQYGLNSERGNRGYPFTAEEIGYVLGRGPETVRAYEEKLRLSFRGEELVPAAHLLPLQDRDTDLDRRMPSAALQPQSSVPPASGPGGRSDGRLAVRSGTDVAGKSVVVTVVPQRKARLSALR